MMNHHTRSLLQGCAAICIAATAGVGHAQENVIESISANQQGSNVIVKIAMKNPVQKPPIGFSITSPARIALDFAGVGSSMKAPMQEVGIGDVRSVNIVQAGERSRLVFNLNRPLNYATAVDGNTVIVTIDGSGGVPVAVNATGTPAVKAVASAGVVGGKPAITYVLYGVGVSRSFLRILPAKLPPMP